ncbi:putative sulfate transport protein CysZ [Streptomyces lavendulae subsp. lavendulae]|uniref:Putative sulfate transport protein CysZ n=1 Tax=Streptomyces lavendulae subsp. lavendulae TaxID=58340 RepID=A0A2K8PK62_STRLA|nr:putative sulfate transport protein CysZ [Streptomyces lavendulae subsp. lavendulae]QUQ56675.1 Sulfate transporter CysZ [Streptomyces lavendulae subsp. lavendulae]
MLAGQRWVFGNGRWLGFGLLPGLVSLLLYAAALTGLFYGADDFTTWATPFASDWSSPWLGLFRGFLTALLIGLGLFLTVITFTAVTLLVGQPFYESLSEQVDRSEGGEVPESGRSFWEDLWISARDSLRLLVRVLLYGILLFALGFIPVVGQTVVPVIGFLVSGFFLTQELTSVALQRRRVDLDEQLALLRGRRALALGFGVPLVLVFLIPLVAVFLMPGAVAGATLMARELTGEDGDPSGEQEGERPHSEQPPAPAWTPAPGHPQAQGYPQAQAYPSAQGYPQPQGYPQAPGHPQPQAYSQPQGYSQAQAYPQPQAYPQAPAHPQAPAPGFGPPPPSYP